MNKFLTIVFLITGSVCFGADEVKEIPSFYLRPELHKNFVDYPGVIQNGYAFIDELQLAKRYFDHLPPEVNFDSEKLIIFVWSGSGQDKIDYEKMENVYHFVFKRGLTKDLKQHIKIVSIPKNNEWIFHRVLE